MLKRLTLLTLAFCITLSALTAVVQIYAASQGHISQIAGFGLASCGSDICFMGIHAGVTRAGDVKAIAQQQGAKFSEESPSLLTFADRNNWIFVNGAGGIQRIVTSGLEKRGIRISVDDVLREYGPPCGISMFPAICTPINSCNGIGWFVLYYGTVEAQVKLNTFTTRIPRLRPDLAVDSLVLVDPGQFKTRTSPCHIYEPGEIASAERPWLGFASLDRYSQYHVPGQVGQ